MKTLIWLLSVIVLVDSHSIRATRLFQRWVHWTPKLRRALINLNIFLNRYPRIPQFLGTSGAQPMRLLQSLKTKQTLLLWERRTQYQFWMNRVKIQIVLIMLGPRFGMYPVYWSQFVIRPIEASFMKRNTSHPAYGKGLAPNDRVSVY